MNVVPFGRLQISTTTADEESIDVLLNESGQRQVKCGVCGGISFVVEAVVKMNLDISFGRSDRQMLIREKSIKTAMLLNIVECATCGSKDFTTEKMEI